MTEDSTKKKTSSYVPMPEVPESIAARYKTMLRVMSGELSPGAAAKELGLSRQRFLTLMHRGLGAMMEAMAPHAAGRPGRSEKEKQMQQRLEELESENAQLHKRVEAIDRVLTLTSELARQRTRPRSKRAKPASTKLEGNDEEESRERLATVVEMRALGVKLPLAAALASTSVATVRRWLRRHRADEQLVRRRGPAVGSRTELGVQPAAAVVELVRSTGGQVGAESLRRSVAGVSRRQAANIKRLTLTAMERERIARSERVIVNAPNVVRGFDAMHVSTREGRRFLLLSGDGCVPFRTSGLAVERYDEAAVARALDEDFGRHGAPLVLRFDRASAHNAPKVRAVLERWKVLPLHGPPRHPRFYGQLERQNREHRAWLEAQSTLADGELQPACDAMLDALNDNWRRRTLGWKTAKEAWDDRTSVEHERDRLHRDVDARKRRLCDGVVDETVAQRIAIETTLTTMGYLKRVIGGWC